MRVLQCGVCGWDNEVADDVVGKLCDACGQALFSPDIIDALPLRATVDRTGQVLRVQCPCGHLTEFPGWPAVDIFICHGCERPVAVDELRQ